MPRDEHNDDDQRYRSIRHQPDDVPPRTWQQVMHEEDFGEGADSHWGGGRGTKESMRSGRQPLYRSDMHGGNARVEPGEYGSYESEARHYRQVRDRYMVEYGPHRGAGPMGYSRSDTRIREDLCDELTDNDMLDATDVEVHVSRGEVTLEGEVDGRAAKRLAEDLAWSVRGVVEVHNRLLTRPRGSSPSPAERH